MYTPEDEALARRIWRRRLMISLAPAAAVTVTSLG